MRPIRQGDGTGLSVPGFSEVRRGDGTVVWSAAPDIPDSAIQQLEMAEGSGSPTADSINNFDASLVNDAAWVSDANAVGDNQIDFPSPPDALEVEIRRNDDYVAGAITVKPDSFSSSSADQIVDGENDGNGNNSHILRNNSNGITEFVIRTGGSFVIIQFSTTVQTGTKTRLGYRFDGSNLAVFHNGSKDNSTAQSGTLDSWIWNAIGYRKYDKNGLVQDRGFDGGVDNFINFATSTASELPKDQFFQDDYNNQPWS
jgi:hypothetical protein